MPNNIGPGADCGIISMQLTTKETAVHGVKHFGEIEVDHTSILLVVPQHKKVGETGPLG